MTTPTQPPAAGEAAHTPSPWTSTIRQIHGTADCEPVIICDADDGHPDFDDIARVCVPDSQRDGGRDGATARANAAFIVRACNSHAALVAALESLIPLYDDARAPSQGLAELVQARAALALAKGGAK